MSPGPGPSLTGLVEAAGPVGLLSIHDSLFIVCVSLCVHAQGQIQEWRPVPARAAGEDWDQPASWPSQGRQRDPADFASGG